MEGCNGSDCEVLRLIDIEKVPDKGEFDMLEKDNKQVLAFTKLQELAIIKNKINFLESEIKSLEIKHGIDALRDAKTKKAKEYQDLLDEIVPTLTFSEDKFLKAAKLKGESYRAGRIKLIRKSRTVRSVIVDKFLKAFPDIEILKNVVSIQVGKAEDEIGKKRLDNFVEKNTTFSYELQDLLENLP